MCNIKRIILLMVMIFMVMVSQSALAAERNVQVEITLYTEKSLSIDQFFDLSINGKILGIINAKSPNCTGKEIPGTIHYYSVNGTSYMDPERFDVKIQYIKGGKVIADYYFAEYDKNEPIQLSYYYSKDGKMSRK